MSKALIRCLVVPIFLMVGQAYAQTPGQTPPMPTDMGDISSCNGYSSKQYTRDVEKSDTYWWNVPPMTYRLTFCNDKIRDVADFARNNRYTNCVFEVRTFTSAGPYPPTRSVASITDCSPPGSAPASAGTFNGTAAHTIAQRYAPAIYLSGGEQWQPSSIEYYAQYVKLECNGGIVKDDILQIEQKDLPNSGGNDCFFVPKNNLSGPYDRPDWLNGQDPSKNPVPVYVFIYTDNRDSPSELNFIAQYSMFFPYNYGKEVCLTLAPNDNCFGARINMGNHVGDWEIVSIRFINGLPKAIHVGAHGNDEPDTASTYFCCAWTPTGNADPSQASIQWMGEHPIVYSAWGSHGMWATADRHNYKTLKTGDKLNDRTSQGVLWKTWEKMVFNSYATLPGNDVLINKFMGRWGAHHLGDHACKMSGMSGLCGLTNIPSDEFQLNDGPNLPSRDRDRNYLMSKTPN